MPQVAQVCTFEFIFTHRCGKLVMLKHRLKVDHMFIPKRVVNKDIVKKAQTNFHKTDRKTEFTNT